jgi:hypothetical protein
LRHERLLSDEILPSPAAPATVRNPPKAFDPAVSVWLRKVHFVEIRMLGWWRLPVASTAHLI